MELDVERPIVMCLSARLTPLQRHYQVGYGCLLCNEPLQASPGGAAALKDGGQPVCNPCGVLFMARLGRAVSASLLLDDVARPQVYTRSLFKSAYPD
jgi:hypothetical protein